MRLCKHTVGLCASTCEGENLGGTELYISSQRGGRLTGRYKLRRVQLPCKRYWGALLDISARLGSIDPCGGEVARRSLQISRVPLFYRIFFDILSSMRTSMARSEAVESGAGTS